MICPQTFCQLFNQLFKSGKIIFSLQFLPFFRTCKQNQSSSNSIYFSQNINLQKFKQYNVEKFKDQLQLYIICSLQKQKSQHMSEGQGLVELLKELPLKQRIPAVALYKLLGEREVVDQEQEQSISKIKASYHQKLKPLLQRASQIIRGAPLKQQQVANAKDYLKPNENISSCLKGKIIDGYWNAVLANSPLVDDISQEDQKALAYLLDIQHIFPSNNKQNENISLQFIFKQNPYFNQKSIVRHLKISNRQMLALEGDQITWKSGNWLTHEKKKITNKKTGESKIDKGKKIKTFFDIFIDWNAQNQTELERTGNFMIQLANLIIMDSVDYFLGLINYDEQSVDEDDQFDQQQQEEAEGSKKIKE